MTERPALPAPLKARLPLGRSPLHWHLLQQESVRTGQPIVCVICRLEHVKPPVFGGCLCGSYRFEVRPVVSIAASGG